MKPDLFEYSNFRDYIKDYYEFKKEGNPRFSFRMLSQKAGVNSSGYFKSLIDGDKNLSEKLMPSVIKAIDLDDNETDYFATMVRFNQAKKVKDKNILFSKLLSLKQIHSIPIVEENKHEFYLKWYHSIIRELVILPDVQDSVNEIERLLLFRVSQSDIHASIQLLFDNGFVERRGNKIVQTDVLISSGLANLSDNIQIFQMQMLQKAMESFNVVPQGEKLHSSTTINISRDAFEKAVHLVRGLRTKLLDLALEEKSPERVYQLNLNLFPFTK